MTAAYANRRRVGTRVGVSRRQGGGLVAFLLVVCLFPAMLLAQPSFDVPQLRRSVVRVLSDQGGSGALIKVEGRRGYILTAHHVIERELDQGVSFVQVELFMEETLQARISRRRVDSANDIAILIVENLPSPLPPVIRWGSAHALGVLHTVYAIGHSRSGPGWEVTTGQVSRLLAGRHRSGRVDHTATWSANPNIRLIAHPRRVFTLLPRARTP